MIMDRVGKGFIAGFIASLALSWLMDPVTLVIRSTWNSPPVVWFLLHFFVGTMVWGAGFGLIYRGLPGPFWLRGTIFSLAAWALIMLAGMPLTGAGWFGLRLGISVPIVSLATHVIYGAVLGLIFGALDRRETPADHEDRSADEQLRPIRP